LHNLTFVCQTYAGIEVPELRPGSAGGGGPLTGEKEIGATAAVPIVWSVLWRSVSSSDVAMITMEFTK
jgi:hypothetical protein